MGGSAVEFEFWLTYRGKLKSDGTSKEKHRIRKAFHPQLEALWKLEPLKTHPGLIDEKHFNDEPLTSVLERVGDYLFAPVVTSKLCQVCMLDIIMLRPEDPGGIVSGGDIDNRLKTLFDALRCPQQESEIPCDADKALRPLYCLMQDDSLITGLHVTVDRLLDYKSKSEVLLLIKVTTRVTRKPMIFFDAEWKS